MFDKIIYIWYNILYRLYYRNEEVCCHMRMDEIGYNHKHDRTFCIDRPNGAGDWLLLIVKSPAVFRIDGKDIHTSANVVILYTPEYPEYYYPDCDEYYDDWIHFEPDPEELELIHMLRIPTNKPVELSDVTELSSIARNMCYEQYSPNLYRKPVVDLTFRILLYKIGEKLLQKTDCSRISESVYLEKLLWIRESLYRWPGREYSIDDMANDLSLSRSRFQHLYTETFGTSVKADLIKGRMEKACELLQTTDLPVKEVGILVGYGNTSYFIRLFRNTYGLTPVQYREKIGEPESS